MDIQESVKILVDYSKQDDITGQFSSSISMVPNILRELSPKSFNPRIVSIGPIHHDDVNLIGSEGLKRTYMRNLFICLGCAQKQTLEECLRKVNGSLHKIKESYGRLRSYNDPELAIMMVVDSCFILEFLYRFKEELGANVLLFRDINMDLLLVENQIPFFVLNNIFECTISKCEPSSSLMDHILPVLGIGNQALFKEVLTVANEHAQSICHHHILGLLHNCYQLQLTTTDTISFRFDFSTIHNAVDLDNAGVIFKPNQDMSNPLSMKLEFSRFAEFSSLRCRPTLKMPVLLISEFTELFLRNLIAYEQTSQVHQYFTSYVIAIDMLVDSKEDVAKLVESQVLVNIIGSNEEAAKMLNNISKEVAIHNFSYSNQWEQLHAYYMSYWPRNIAWLRRTYFSSPWNVIALLAGIILFALTVVQTFFAVNSKN